MWFEFNLKIMHESWAGILSAFNEGNRKVIGHGRKKLKPGLHKICLKLQNTASVSGMGNNRYKWLKKLFLWVRFYRKNTLENRYFWARNLTGIIEVHFRGFFYVSKKSYSPVLVLAANHTFPFTYLNVEHYDLPSPWCF